MEAVARVAAARVAERVKVVKAGSAAQMAAVIWAAAIWVVGGGEDRRR